MGKPKNRCNTSCSSSKKIYVKCFLGPGTSCCFRIRVNLSGVVKQRLGRYSGIYEKDSYDAMVNGRNYWHQKKSLYNNNTGHALWYDNVYNVWTIGDSSDLGLYGGIYSVQDRACPTNINQFLYSDENKRPFAPNNSISIQCWGSALTKWGGNYTNNKRLKAATYISQC